MATVSFRVDDEIKERFDRVVADRNLNASSLFRQALLDKLVEIEPDEGTENKFAFTVRERMALTSQLRILELLVGEEERLAIKQRIKILEAGYEFHYSEISASFSSGLSRRSCIEVMDILGMFDHLYFSWERLDGKSDISQTDVGFLGFDGNHESKQRWYASFLLFDRGQYENLHNYVKRDQCDSHWPMLGTYRKMLKIFNERCHAPHPLSAAAIKAIVAEYSS